MGLPAGFQEISMQRMRYSNLSRRIFAAFFLIFTLVLALLPQKESLFSGLSSDTITYERGTVTAVLEENLTPSDLKGGQMLGDQTVVIALNSGETVQVTNYLTDTHNVRAEEGLRVVVCVDAPEGVEPYYTLYQYDRSTGVAVILGVFLLLMLLVGGEKGFSAALALAFSMVFLIRVTIPAIYAGGSPLGAGLAAVLLATTVTIFLLYGFVLRGGLAVVVTLAGEGMACFLFWMFSALLHLTGFQSSDAESLLVAARNTGMDLSTVLFAATMIASLGAVMDVAVSLLSALWEVHETDPALPGKRLFASGMHIGRDMIGTMSNTLVFAFAGGSLTTILVLIAYGTQPNQLLHSDYVALELAQGLCGTCAVILTVPLASLAAALVFPKLQNSRKVSVVYKSNSKKGEKA